MQVLRPRAQTVLAPPRPALAERNSVEQPPFEVRELRARTRTSVEQKILEDEVGREEAPVGRELVRTGLIPAPVNASREGRKKADFQGDVVEFRKQTARVEPKGREVQTEALPAEVFARVAREVTV